MSRAHRWIGVLALLFALAFMARVGLAQARTAEPGATRPPAAEPYRDGPLGEEPFSLPDLPRGAEELLGLTVLSAIVYGLRASDLGRRGRSGRGADS